MVALRLDLSTLKPGHNVVRLDAQPADLGLPDGVWQTPFTVEIDVDRAGEQYRVRARIATASEEECSRCLTRFRVPLDFGADVYADRQGTGGRYERELSEDDFVVFHDGRHVDLDDQVREAAILARPMAPLCRPDCRGLCPRCGADLNEGPCPHSEG